jgi:RNA polymerase sigma-70 factor (ECF subfamily)
MQPTETEIAAPGSAAQWIESAKRGDQEALGRSLEMCRQYLTLVADRELGKDLKAKAGASDLVQQTFLEAHRDFDRFQGRTESELRAWLRAILRNDLAHVADRYRRTAKREIRREVAIDDSAHAGLRETLVEETQPPSVRAVLREEEEALRCAMARLPERHRRILHWRNRDGESFEQIGRRLDISAGAARKTWGRVIVRLQVEMRCGIARGV